MRMTYAILTLTILMMAMAQNAAAKNQKIDEYEEAALLEANSPSSGRMAPTDFDSLYRIAISKNESLKLGGSINFQPSIDVAQQPEATLHVKYSMNF